MARAINSEVKEGRGSPHGGVFLDVSTRLPAEEITRRLPSMYHQFKELADVDITAEPMEVGPTCHYVMGGIEVDADTAAAARARPVRGGRGRRRHARLEPARRQLAVRPAGVRPPGGRRRAPDYVARARRPAARPLAEADVAAAVDRRCAPFGDGRRARRAENPYTLHQELQQTMNDLVGIIRREGEMARRWRSSTS